MIPSIYQRLFPYVSWVSSEATAEWAEKLGVKAAAVMIWDTLKNTLGPVK